MTSDPATEAAPVTGTVLARTDVEALVPRLPDDGRTGRRLLDWLTGEVRLGGTSLETGAGAATVVLGGLSRRHVAVTPDATALGRVRRWCDEHGVTLEGTSLVEARPELHLARDGGPGDLDVVLLGREPAYPVPAVDWHLAVPRLRLGGLLVVARTDVRAGAELAAFLGAERDRWRPRHRTDDAAVFEKVAPTEPVRWTAQPWNRAVPSLDTRLRTVRDRLRGAAR